MNEPGSYRIKFSDEARAYVDAFYGGQGTVEDATPVELTSGETRMGVDIALEPMRLGSISGVVTGAGTLRWPARR